MSISSVKMSKKSKSEGYSRTDSSTKLTTRALSSGAGGCTYPPTLPQDTTSAKTEKKYQYYITVWIVYSGILSVFPSDGHNKKMRATRFLPKSSGNGQLIDYLSTKYNHIYKYLPYLI